MTVGNALPKRWVTSRLARSGGGIAMGGRLSDFEQVAKF